MWRVARCVRTGVGNLSSRRCLGVGFVAAICYCAMQKIFDQCPIMPLDASLSLARYCCALKQTLAQAEQFSLAGDLDRSILLLVRCVQMANRTLPAHPEYSLPQSEPWVRELRQISGRCLHNLETLKPRIAETAEKVRLRKLEE